MPERINASEKKRKLKTDFRTCFLKANILHSSASPMLRKLESQPTTFISKPDAKKLTTCGIAI